jgi:hypothetical protein
MELSELWNCIPKSEGKNNYKSKVKINDPTSDKRGLIWGTWRLPHIRPTAGRMWATRDISATA